jgi:hypothetical protein
MELIGAFYIEMVTQHLDTELIPDIRPPNKNKAASQV